MQETGDEKTENEREVRGKAGKKRATLSTLNLGGSHPNPAPAPPVSK